VASGGAVLNTFGRLLCKGRLRLFPLYTARVVHRVVASTSIALRLLPRVRVRTGMWRPPPAKHEGPYPQFRYVCPKRWERLYCNGNYGAMYDSTDTRRRQRSVIDRTLGNSGLGATETRKWD